MVRSRPGFVRRAPPTAEAPRQLHVPAGAGQRSMSPTTKKSEPRTVIRSSTRVPGQHRGQRLDVVERRRPQLEPPRRRLALRDQVVARCAERVLRPHVDVRPRVRAPSWQPDVDRTGRRAAGRCTASTRSRDTSAWPSRQSNRARASPAVRVTTRHGELAVGQVRVVPAQVHVQPGGAGDRPADPVRRGVGLGSGRRCPGAHGQRSAGSYRAYLGARAAAGPGRSARRPARPSLRPPTRLAM